MLGGHLDIFCKNCIVCLKKTENKRKRGWGRYISTSRLLVGRAVGKIFLTNLTVFWITATTDLFKQE